MTNSKDPDGIEQGIRTLFDSGALESAATLLVASYGGEIFRFLQSRLRVVAEAGILNDESGSGTK